MVGESLAFIPARGGSKRVPGKNIRLVAGKPLLVWTIEAAVKSAVFSRVVVSSDDETILDLAKRSGSEVDHRPAELATDRARNFQVLAEFLERPENRGLATVALLPPTSPLRTAADIGAAVEFWAKQPEDFVVSVTGYEFPPEFACDLDSGSATLHLRHPDVYAHSTQSQSVKPAVHPNGAIYLGSVSRFLQEQTFFAPPIRGFLMSPERSIDIDLPHHFAVVEAVLQQQ